LAVRSGEASIRVAEDLRQRRRVSVVVTLREIDFELLQLFRDGLALDVLRDGQQAERLSSFGETPHEGFRVDIVEHAAHETPVDLQVADLESLEMRE